ncbi:major facilitator superfamily domain-containing protein [Aspergillus pseudodeflectus]|uniref:Major facilitator superfamily domain-containing protein n=1 Tax=Aspergillus pseudodeflectus TaxID=176178 RepID=A0ABR4KGM4_9EURO
MDTKARPSGHSTPTEQLEKITEQPTDNDLNRAVSPAEFDRILRKVDLRVIPILAIFYLLSFLDRGSIGNANIQGLSETLGLVGQQYNWCLTIFFFPYSFFEPVSNLLLVRLKPSIWLPSIVTAWGIVMTLTGIVQNYSGLLAARFFLGLTEAGLFPGLAFYVSLWYPRANAQFRLALIFASASMAGAFSGLLAYLIVKMDGVGGLEGWRWIFLLEGMLTVIVAIAAFWLVWDDPKTATFLTEREKDILLASLSYTAAGSTTDTQTSNEHSSHWKQVKAAIFDWQTILHCLGYWGVATAVYALSLFLPTIIKGLGYSAAIAQLLTIPVYAAATITCIAVGYFADKTGKRSLFTIVCYLIILIGYIIVVAPPRFIPGLIYAGCFIAACGMYPAIPGLLALASNNWAPDAKRAIGIAIQIGVGSMGGAAASNFYRSTDSPRYRLGHSLVLTFTALGLLTTVSYYVICKRLNARRDAMGASEHGYSEEELISMGDKAPTFRYRV